MVQAIHNVAPSSSFSEAPRYARLLHLRKLGSNEDVATSSVSNCSRGSQILLTFPVSGAGPAAPQYALFCRSSTQTGLLTGSWTRSSTPHATCSRARGVWTCWHGCETSYTLPTSYAFPFCPNQCKQPCFPSAGVPPVVYTWSKCVFRTLE